MTRWWVVTQVRIDGYMNVEVYATRDMAEYMKWWREVGSLITQSGTGVGLFAIRIPFWVSDVQRWATDHPKKWKVVPARDV
jgi:hypothetical protein